MALSPENIVPAIRNGQCRKLGYPDFDDRPYFVDQHGAVYSLNNPREPKEIEQKIGNGLAWVTLYNKDGIIRRAMVGDLIAHTYLKDQERSTDQTTVRYIDGDTMNNAVDNLEWCTPVSQQHQLRSSHMKKLKIDDSEQTSDKNPSDGTGNDGEQATDDIPFQIDPVDDPILDQLHVTQLELDEARSRIKELTEALKPFALFYLSPRDAAETGNAVVLESNRGTQRESRLTVQDFRFAKLAVEPKKGTSK